MKPACPACESTAVRYDAVEASCARCAHSWPVEQLTLDLGELVVRAPTTPAHSPLRAIRDRSARRRWQARQEVA